MSNKLRVFFLFLSTFLLLAPWTVPAFAATKKISGTTNVEDTYMAKDNPDWGYGGSNELVVASKYVGTYYDRALIRVKNVASELGAGATNITAVCSVYCWYNYIDDNIGAYRVFKPYKEGTIYADICTGTDKGVSWNDWNCLDLEWGTVGCANASDAGSDNSGDGTDYDRKATAEASATSVTTVNTWYSWSISTELATGWYNGTIAENGIILVGDTTTGGYNKFYSTEYGTDATKCPFFVFTYTTGGAASKSTLPLIREQRK